MKIFINVHAIFFDKKRGMTRTDGHSKNEEIEINKGYGIFTS